MSRKKIVNIKINELNNILPFKNLFSDEFIINNAIRYILYLKDKNNNNNKIINYLKTENKSLKNIINDMEYEYIKLNMKYLEIANSSII